MAALIRFFDPVLNAEQSQQRIQALLQRGQGKCYYQQTEGALRYIIADNGVKGLTFAIEPVKLVLVAP